MKKAFVPGHGKRGMGELKGPRKAAYSKARHKATFNIFDLFKRPGIRPTPPSSGVPETGGVTHICDAHGPAIPRTGSAQEGIRQQFGWLVASTYEKERKGNGREALGKHRQ